MLAGVATGVRNAAAAATHTHMSAGLGETPSCAAADTAIGIIMSAVAALLMSWLNNTVTTNRAASSMTGPAPAV